MWQIDKYHLSVGAIKINARYLISMSITPVQFSLDVIKCNSIRPYDACVYQDFAIRSVQLSSFYLRFQSPVRPIEIPGENIRKDMKLNWAK